MATQARDTTRAQPTAEARTYAAIEPHVGIRERLRQYRAERERRVIVQWLRRTASRAHDTDPIRRHREALLHYRAAAVHTDLLEIAAMLERTQRPSRECIATLHELLANGCDSPLYNPNIHVSELHATLDHLRAALTSHT
jgi:hypothetical protein